jgi:hypothetical protein
MTFVHCESGNPALLSDGSTIYCIVHESSTIGAVMPLISHAFDGMVALCSQHATLLRYLRGDSRTLARQLTEVVAAEQD